MIVGMILLVDIILFEPLSASKNSSGNLLSPPIAIHEDGNAIRSEVHG